jgi:hypothetical protein
LDAPRRTVAIDVLIASAAFALTLVVLGFDHGADRGLDALGVVLAAVASLPLLARRREPLAIFALTTAASATLNGLGYAVGPPFGPTIALFFVAADDRSRERSLETAGVVLALFATHVAATASAHSGFPTSAVLFGIVVWGGAWMIGDQVRQRRRRRADLEERIRRAERETQRERRLAAAEERTRIARDLHDSAAHAINVILVQAGAARLLHEQDPERSRAALETIEDVARGTLGEIDQLVRALRENGAAAGVEPPPPWGKRMTLPISRGLAGSSPLSAASWRTVVWLRAASAPRLSPGWTVYVPGAEAVICGAPCAARAAFASATVGTLIVCPKTTCASGDRPLAAASARVVRLLAYAIVHSVSPGRTTCGMTAGDAAGIARTAAVAAPTTDAPKKAFRGRRICPTPVEIAPKRLRHKSSGAVTCPCKRRPTRGPGSPTSASGTVPQPP